MAANPPRDPRNIEVAVDSGDCPICGKSLGVVYPTPSEPDDLLEEWNAPPRCCAVCGSPGATFPGVEQATKEFSILGEGADDCITLWTLQPPEVIPVLQSDGVLHGVHELALYNRLGYEKLQEPYTWMREQMLRRIPNCSGKLPIWAWSTPPTYKQHEPSVLLTMRIPRRRILMSYFPAWHEFVLMDRYLPRPGEMIDPMDYSAFTYEDMRRSWENIFNLPPGAPVHDIQVCIDGVFAEDIISIVTCRMWPKPVFRERPQPMAAAPASSAATAAPAGDHPPAPVAAPTPAAPSVPTTTPARALHDRRVAYEARLGHFCAHHPRALFAAKSMVAACVAYMRARTEELHSAPKREKEMARLRRLCATPVEADYAGRVGTDPAELLRVFRGDGDLRELMCHAYLFITQLLAADMAGPLALPVETLNLVWRAAGFDVSAMAQIMNSATKHAKKEREELAPNRDLAKLPWTAVRKSQVAMRLPVRQLVGTDNWSRKTRTQFEAEGGRLSAFASRLESPAGPEFVPWFDTASITCLDAQDGFVKAATDLGMPLVSGLSGMMLQYMVFGKAMNCAGALDLRLMSLGYMLTTQSHSFHEVCAVAALNGVPYPVAYDALAPCTTEEIREACGVPPSLGVGA